MKIKYVDGFEIKRTIMPNFHYCGKYGEYYGCELIPKGEMWIEKEYRDESKQIVRSERSFQKLMKRMSYQEARRYINQQLFKKRNVVTNKRSYNNYNTLEKRTAASSVKKWIQDLKYTIPNDTNIVEIKLLLKLKIFFVDGKFIRNNIDVLFVYGGHEFVYDYIPKNEIWLDRKQNPKELKYTFFHELYEYQLMKKGMDYDSAHDFAIAFEMYLKRKDGVADYAFDAEENRKKIYATKRTVYK